MHAAAESAATHLRLSWPTLLRATVGSLPPACAALRCGWTSAAQCGPSSRRAGIGVMHERGVALPTCRKRRERRSSTRCLSRRGSRRGVHPCNHHTACAHAASTALLTPFRCSSRLSHTCSSCSSGTRLAPTLLPRRRRPETRRAHRRSVRLARRSTHAAPRLYHTSTRAEAVASCR